MERDARYLVLASERDWLYSRGDNISYSAGSRGVALRPRSLLAPESAVSLGLFGWGELPESSGVAMAADHFGRLHLCASKDGGQEYWIYDDRLKRAEKNTFITKSAHGVSQIVCSPNHVFTVSPEEENGVRAFDSYTSQYIWDPRAPGEPGGDRPQAFRPLCAEYAGSERCFLLVSAVGTAGGKAADAKAADGKTAAERFAILRTRRSGGYDVLWRGGAARVSAARTSPLTSPFDMAYHQPGGLYILDRAGKQLLRFSPDNGVLERLCAVTPEFSCAGLAADGEGYLYTAAHEDGAGFMCRFDPSGLKAGGLNPLEHVLPGYTGAVDGFAADGRRLFILDRAARTVTVARVWEGFNAGASGAAEGWIQPLEPFDSRAAGNKWHKITLDADFDEAVGDGITIRYCAADEELRPEEVVFERGKVNAADTLTDVRGRYLWIRLDLAGTAESSPVVRHVKAYFSGHRYMDYLPAVYQRDEAEGEPLYRYLSVFESLFSDMERKIDCITALFDPCGADERFLAWLAGWLAIPEAQRDFAGPNLRRFMRSAPGLYKIRGTKAYFEALTEIFLSRRPIVVEQFQAQPFEEAGGPLSDVMVSLFGKDPFAFFLLISPFVPEESSPGYSFKPLDTTAMAAFRDVVELEKPAHTVGNAVFLEPYVRLDGHTYLGVNSCLMEPVPALCGNAFVGDAAAMKDRRDDGAAEVRSFLDGDAALA